MVTSLPPVMTPTTALTILENWLQGNGKAVVGLVAKFVEILKACFEMDAPINAGEVIFRETELHRRVARECLVPAMKEILQRAHEAPNVRKQADSLARMGGFTPQLAQASVLVVLMGGSIRELRTPYYLRRPRKVSQEATTSKVRGKPGNGIYPILSQLGLHYSVSPALGSEVTRLAAQGVQRDAIENLAGRGIDLKLKVLQRIVRDFAERATPPPGGWTL